MFWDIALDYGIDGTKASCAILKIMCRTVFAARRCMCPANTCFYHLPVHTPLFDHLLSHHVNLQSNMYIILYLSNGFDQINHFYCINLWILFCQLALPFSAHSLIFNSSCPVIITQLYIQFCLECSHSHSHTTPWAIYYSVVLYVATLDESIAAVSG